MSDDKAVTNELRACVSENEIQPRLARYRRALAFAERQPVSGDAWLCACAELGVAWLRGKVARGELLAFEWQEPAQCDMSEHVRLGIAVEKAMDAAARAGNALLAFGVQDGGDGDE